MILLAFLVSAAFAIVLGALAWGRANGTLTETSQERIDREFELIVRQLAD